MVIFRVLFHRGRYVVTGWKADTDVGPLISAAAKARCLRLIESAKKEGCCLLLDGSNISVKGFNEGYFVGPTIIDGVQPHMQCYKVILIIFVLYSRLSTFTYLAINAAFSGNEVALWFYFYLRGC